MSKPNVRVFTRETVLRLGLQNAVLRKLRAMGCKVRWVSLDSMLTIEVDPSSDFLRRRTPGGISMRRTEGGREITIDVDGCRVMWMEKQTS